MWLANEVKTETPEEDVGTELDISPPTATSALIASA